MDGQLCEPKEVHLIEPVRKATVEDAEDIASRLRAADRREAVDSIGIAPTILLPLAAKNPDTFVGLDADGRPQVMFGVDPVIGDPNMGIIWLMATKTLEEDRATQFRFLRNTMPMVHQFHEKYPMLGNYVDSRNELHLKWCKWLGFKTIKRVEKWGWRGLPFIQIVRIRGE